MVGADVFIGVSGGQVADSNIARMAPRGIVFALAIPDPEVHPQLAARHAEAIATGALGLPEPDQQRSPRRYRELQGGTGSARRLSPGQSAPSRDSSEERRTQMGNGYGKCINCQYGRHTQCNGKQCSCADNGHH